MVQIGAAGGQNIVAPLARPPPVVVNGATQHAFSHIAPLAEGEQPAWPADVCVSSRRLCTSAAAAAHTACLLVLNAGAVRL